MLVNTIYESISGEVGGPNFPQGSWCTFLRFQGCSLRCSFCDTPQALSRRKHKATDMTPEEIVRRLKEIGNRRILVTGGEPLEQPRSELRRLFDALLEQGHIIQVETAGHVPLLQFDGPGSERVYYVVDQKTPSSRMDHKNISVTAMAAMVVNCGVENVVMKYVISNDNDIQWAAERVRTYMHYPETRELKHAFSPVDGSPSGVKDMLKKLKRRINFDDANLVISIQLHKIIVMP